MLLPAPPTRAPHPASCTFAGCEVPSTLNRVHRTLVPARGWVPRPAQEFSHGVIYLGTSAHKKCHPHRWGVRGLRGEISQLRQTRCLPVPYFFLNFLKSMFCAPAPPAVNGAQLDPQPDPWAVDRLMGTVCRRRGKGCREKCSHLVFTPAYP